MHKVVNDMFRSFDLESNHENLEQQEDNFQSNARFQSKFGDQVLLETRKILLKLSTSCTGPYPVANVYKNGTVRIQKFEQELYQKEGINSSVWKI
jgi:hypothetical protein